MKNFGDNLLLDTNAVTAISRPESAAEAVRNKCAQLFIPAIVVGEYQAGILGLKKNSESEKNFRRLLTIAEVLPADWQTANHYAEIYHELKTKGRPIPTNDMWIAAIARQHDLPIMARDKHFQYIDHIQTVGW